VAHTSLTLQTVRERVAALRSASHSAQREIVAVKAAVDQRLAESRACVQRTALLLHDLRHVPRR
jgi:hypothetical protein